MQWICSRNSKFLSFRGTTDSWRRSKAISTKIRLKFGMTAMTILNSLEIEIVVKFVVKSIFWEKRQLPKFLWTLIVQIFPRILHDYGFCPVLWSYNKSCQFCKDQLCEIFEAPYKMALESDKSVLLSSLSSFQCPRMLALQKQSCSYSKTQESRVLLHSRSRQSTRCRHLC